MREMRKCIYYKQAKVGAVHGTEDALFLCVISDEGCLKDGAKYRHNGHGHDGKHGLCEDKLVTDTEIQSFKIWPRLI